MKIGILGGSFDPPHRGHLQIAEELIHNQYVDNIWFLPCFQSLHGKSLTHHTHRLAMLHELVMSSYMSNRMTVCQWEIQRQASGRTLEVIEKMIPYFKNQFEDIDDEYYMIIGEDNAENFNKFREWETVVKKAPFIIVPRENHDYNGDWSLADNEARDKHWFEHDPHIIAEIKIAGYSSTMVREGIKGKGENGIPKEVFYAIPNGLFKYIIEKDLYV
tara:strand:+ start:16714 stop:17364 length:651 start_codon:yes stop_codon:yes gene_type:complete